MPKITMTFLLPEEQHEYDTVRQAGEMASVIYEFTSLIRDKAKYGAKQEVVSWDVLYKQWWALLKEHKIDPYGD